MAKDEAPQAAGVRRRRLDGAAASAQHFGALLVGYYDDGALRWAGSVGTGFDQASSIASRSCSRARESPRVRSRRLQDAGTPALGRPELVAEVRFTEWTSEGLLRQPVYWACGRTRKRRSRAGGQASGRPKGEGQRPKAEGERPKAQGERPKAQGQGNSGPGTRLGQRDQRQASRTGRSNPTATRSMRILRRSSTS